MIRVTVDSSQDFPKDGRKWGDELQSIAFLYVDRKGNYKVENVHLDLICLGVYRRWYGKFNGVLHLPRDPDYDMRSKYLTWLVEESFFSDAYEWAEVLCEHTGEVILKDCVIIKPVELRPKYGASISSQNFFGMLSCLIRHDWEYPEITRTWLRLVKAGVEKDIAYVLAQCCTGTGDKLRTTLHNPVGPLLDIDRLFLSDLLQKKVFKPAESQELDKRLTFERWKLKATNRKLRLDCILPVRGEHSPPPSELWPFDKDPEVIIKGELERSYDVDYLIENWQEIKDRVLRSLKKEEV